MKMSLNDLEESKYSTTFLFALLNLFFNLFSHTHSLFNLLDILKKS